jgi:hypothetical protein
MVESFVDTAPFSGTCYIAAGFKLLGQTQGFAKTCQYCTYHGKQKAVFIKVLDQGFHLELGIRPNPHPLRIDNTKEGTEK